MYILMLDRNGEVARPRSEDKRNAILAAATRVIAAEGLGARTASIAKQAGVASGTLFTYFTTKSELLNELYLELKTEMAAGALAGLSPGADARAQMAHLWSRWLTWGVEAPEKRRALAQLVVSEEITEASRRKGHEIMASMARIMDRSRESGPMKEAPLDLVVAMMSAMAETAIDYVLQNPGRAEESRQHAFDALWRMVG